MNNEKSAIQENLFNNHLKKNTLITSEFIKLKIAFTVLKF